MLPKGSTLVIDYSCNYNNDMEYNEASIPELEELRQRNKEREYGLSEEQLENQLNEYRKAMGGDPVDGLNIKLFMADEQLKKFEELG